MKRKNIDKHNWLAVHCVILYFYEKAHSSGLYEYQLQVDRRAVDLLQRVIKAYNQGSDRCDDWKFCLLPSTVVSEIVMKKAIRDSSSEDSPYSITEEESGSLTERIICGDILHHKKLLNLQHPNLCINLCMTKSPVGIVELISVASPLGNLKEYVLNGRCEETILVTFLSQVASALQYLHENHIVHAALRAENVNVVELQEGVLQVQIIRFGRSKSLEMRPGKDSSNTAVVSADMPPDSTRWSAPEVILQGLYSHASDVWSFGVVAWELYAAVTNGARFRERTLPYFHISNDEILPNIQINKLLHKPNSCPDWVYIMMQQCWSYNSKLRPPFIALFKKLARRKSMQYLSMSEIEEEPFQRREDSEKMSSYDFLTEHEYQQVSTVRSCEIHSLKTDNYETFPVTKASEQLPLPTSEMADAYENLACNGSSSQSQLSALTTTQVYETLPTHRIKQPTLPIPRSTSLANSDKQVKRHAQLRVTTI